MRRFFLRPTFTKLAFALLATFGTYAFAHYLTPGIDRFKLSFKFGLDAAYAAIGIDNPVLKLITLSIFWFVVAWVLYLVVYVLEFVYIKIYNFFIIKTKYVNK